jgi:hypothetical protein
MFSYSEEEKKNSGVRQLRQEDPELETSLGYGV